jgi:MFS transporter, DHA2 family, multidrug resistance protein
MKESDPSAAVNKWLIALSVGFGAVMGTIDSSIVNVSLPHIRGSVGATLQEITWISTAYIITTVLVMPLTGFLGAFFGQKRVYQASLLIFLIGSALCGMARSFEALVAFRAIQGLGAGSLQPTQQAILRQTFPKEEQGMAVALFAMVIMIGPAVGPTLGGWITDNYNWPWIFYINLPIGALGLLMVARFVHEPEDVLAANRARASQLRGSVDWSGIGLICIGVAALQYVLEEGQSEDWFESSSIRLASFTAAVALVAFVIRELTTPTPAVDLRLFKDRTFAIGTVLGAVQFSMLIGSMFLLPIYMQEVLGFSATDAGIGLMPRVLTMLAVTPLVGRLYNHVPPALTVSTGVVLFAIGSYQLSHVTLDTSTAELATPLVITGIAFACLFVPLTTTALSNIPRHKLIDASGLNSFVRQIGASVGLAVFATLLTRFSAQAKAGLLPLVSAARPETVSFLEGAVTRLGGHGFDAAATRLAALAIVNGRVTAQAMILAFEKSFLLQGMLLLLVLPLALMLRANRQAAIEDK